MVSIERFTDYIRYRSFDKDYVAVYKLKCYTRFYNGIDTEKLYFKGNKATVILKCEEYFLEHRINLVDQTIITSIDYIFEEVEPEEIAYERAFDRLFEKNNIFLWFEEIDIL
jgi:hypothetical protein